MTVPETDGEVIASSLVRPQRFEAIFDRHATSVHRYLRRRLGEPVAEELTAETFARAFRYRRQFDAGHVSALPWLYGIAVHLIRMHVRSEQRRQRAFRRFAQDPVEAASTADTDARLDARALRPALYAALASLPPDQREVLLLHAWAGLSTVEIAEALSVSGATVRKRLHRARAKAAAQLERHDQQAIDTVSQTRTAQ